MLNVIMFSRLYHSGQGQDSYMQFLFDRISACQLKQTLGQ